MNLQQRASAQIYEFPVGGRSGLGGQSLDVQPRLHEATVRAPSVLGASESWYHAEAIAAEAREVKPA